MIAIAPVENFPLLTGPAELAPLVIRCLREEDVTLQDGDVLVVAHKVISKAEGRVVALADVKPSSRARELAARAAKDPRLVELILRESVRLVRAEGGVLICETRHGLICANAGVDRSNAGPDHAVLLPVDPDASARRLRTALQQAFGIELAVLVADSHGRPWREGAVGLCIGLAGLEPFRDYRGCRDLFAYEMRTEIECLADELCAAATLVMGQGEEGVPLALVRGFPWKTSTSASARDLLRPPERDLFR